MSFKKNNEEFGQEITKFGDCTITTEGIKIFIAENIVDPNYFIPKERLWETSKIEDKGREFRVWEWLLHMAEKTWLEESKLYQLNTAFFFAKDYFKDLRPKTIKTASDYMTLKIQSKVFEKR